MLPISPYAILIHTIAGTVRLSFSETQWDLPAATTIEGPDEAISSMRRHFDTHGLGFQGYAIESLDFCAPVDIFTNLSANQGGEVMGFDVLGYVPDEVPELTQEEDDDILESAIDDAAHEAATSPKNDLPEPTEAQKMAGSYRLGHIVLHGLNISIEIPKGAFRSGIAQDGMEWKTKLTSHYGYIKRTSGADDENIDVYVGASTDSERVFVVDQLDSRTGKFDEHKAVLAVKNAEEARRIYSEAFSDGRGEDRIGAITELSMDDFKVWMKSHKTKKPMSAAVMESAQEDWRDEMYAAMAEDFVLESSEKKEPFDLRPSIVGKLKGRVVEELNTLGFDTKESVVAYPGKTALHIRRVHGEQLTKDDEKYVKLAIEDPHEILPNKGESGKEYRDRSVLMVHKAQKSYIAIVEVGFDTNNGVLWNFWKIGAANAEKYLSKFRKEKARILSHGGATVHIPRIPHGTPDGEVGQPEGLPGSREQETDLFESSISPENEKVNHDLDTATTFEDIHAVFAGAFPGVVKEERKVPFNVIEYITQGLFKGKSLEAAVKAFIKKFKGEDNLFLGDTSWYEFDILKEAVLKDKAISTIDGAKKMKEGKGNFSLDGGAQRFNIPRDVLAKAVAEQLAPGDTANGVLADYPDLAK